MRPFLFAALALAGCALDVLPVNLLEDTPEHRDLVAGAARDAFGLEVEYVDGAPGAVTVNLRVVRPDVPIGTVVEVGGADPDGCEPSFWAHPSAVTVAHEIGHVLGLRHRSRRGNLMTPQPTGWDVTEVQMDAVWLGVERLHRCE